MVIVFFIVEWISEAIVTPNFIFCNHLLLAKIDQQFWKWRLESRGLLLWDLEEGFFYKFFANYFLGI